MMEASPEDGDPLSFSGSSLASPTANSSNSQFFYDLIPKDVAHEEPPNPEYEAGSLPLRRSSRSSATGSIRSGSTSPYVFPTDNSDTESLHWSHDDTAEWLPQLSPCPSSSSSCPSPRRSSRPAHFSSRPPRRNKRKVTTDSEMEPELYLSRTDLADSLIWPQIQEEVRTFVAKVRQKHPRAKSKDPPIIESEPHPPEIPAEPNISSQQRTIRPILMDKIMELEDQELQEAQPDDVIQFQRLSYHFPLIEFPHKSKCGGLMKWILVDHDFPLPKFHFFRSNTFLLDPTEEEVRFLSENFPEFTMDPFSAQENRVLLTRLKFVFKCLGWSSREVMRNLTELAMATKRERRILGRYVLAAFVGRPLLHYRCLSQIVRAILILTYTTNISEIRHKDLVAIQSSITANKRKGWSVLRKHFNVVKLVKDQKLVAANSHDLLHEEIKIVLLTAMRHMNSTDLANIDPKSVPLSILAEVTNRSNFKEKSFSRLVGRLRRLQNGVDAESHFHNQRDILEAVIQQGVEKLGEIDWKPIEDRFPSYTRGCLTGIMINSLKNQKGTSNHLKWQSSLEIRKKQRYKNSRHSIRYEKDMAQLEEAYNWAKATFESKNELKISIDREDESLL